MEHKKETLAEKLRRLLLECPLEDNIYVPNFDLQKEDGFLHNNDCFFYDMREKTKEIKKNLASLELCN